MRRIFIYTSVVFIILWVTLFFVFHFTTYSNFTDQIVQLLIIEDKETIFLTVFSPNIFIKLKWLFLLLSVIQISILIIGIKKPKVLQKLKKCIFSITEYPLWIWNSFNKLNQTEKIIFGLFLTTMIIQRLWLSSITGVIYDEAWTYLAFTSKNPFVAFCFYPTSNNHILFSHLTQITKFLPFDILTNLRLSALIPNILAVITLFFCLRKYFKPITTWIGITLFSFSFPMVYYGFAARGYSLIVLFFIIGFFSVLAILHNNDDKKAWYRLMISSVLGLYTIPVYLYPFISLFGFVMVFFLFIKNKTAIIRTLRYGILTCILTFTLYAPVFAVSGIESVTNNKFVATLDIKQVMGGFIQHINQTLRFFTVSKIGYLFGLAGIVILVMVFKKFKFKVPVYLAIFTILIIPLFIFIHKVLPVERTWIYLLVPLIFLVSIIINNFKWPVFFWGLSIIYILFIQSNWNKQMLWYDQICEEDYIEGNYFSNYFHNKKATIVTSSRMNTYLKFNKLLRDEEWNIQSQKSDSVNYNGYYIHYNEKETLPPTGLVKITTFRKYELSLLK